MKHIKKSKEPKTIEECRTTPGSSYDDLRKAEVREVLLADQGHICCYCMQRIKDETMQIEHWEARSDKPELQLDWMNMLGVCPGNEKQPKELRHCDESRGNQKLTLNPADPHKNCEDFIKYNSSGKISSDDSTIDYELDQILRLNIQTHKENRQAVIDAAISALNKIHPRQTWSKTSIEREMKKWEKRNSENKYQPYCQAAISYLKKRVEVKT